MQNKFKKAFTLIELLIVIAIIAILTVAFLPGALKAPARARDAGKIKKVQDIVAAVEAYNAQKMSYPSTDAGVKNCFTQGIADVISMGGDLPVDPAGLGSCATTGVDMNKFLYMSGSGFYVVGVKVEMDNSANAFLSSAPTTVPTDLANAKTTLLNNKTQSTPPRMPYYIVVGP